MEVIIVILLGIIILGIVGMLNYTDKMKCKVDDLTKLLETEKTTNQMYKREIDRIEYDKKIKDCKLEDMIIGKNVTHHIQKNKKVKVLVGDYYLPSVRNTCGLLMKMGFDVEAVQSGDDIVELISKGTKYDLIITNNEYDHHSNYKRGVDVLHELKEIKGFKIPVIILTVSNNRKEFIADGFNEHIQKILDEKKVMDIFPKVLKNLKFEAIKKQ